MSGAPVHLEARRLAKRVIDVLGATGANVFRNTGASAGQTVAHCHVHVVPRYHDSDPTRRFREHELDHTPLAELQALADQLREDGS